MAAAIFEVHGQQYVSQKGIGLYPTSGTARDWFYSEDANALNKHRSAGYTMELRDTGEYGFLLPPDQVSTSYSTREYTAKLVLFVCLFVVFCMQIIPTGEEMVPAVLFFAEILNNFPIPKSSR